MRGFVERRCGPSLVLRMHRKDQCVKEGQTFVCQRGEAHTEDYTAHCLGPSWPQIMERLPKTSPYHRLCPPPFLVLRGGLYLVRRLRFLVDAVATATLHTLSRLPRMYALIAAHVCPSWKHPGEKPGQYKGVGKHGK